MASVSSGPSAKSSRALRRHGRIRPWEPPAGHRDQSRTRDRGREDDNRAGARHHQLTLAGCQQARALTVCDRRETTFVVAAHSTALPACLDPQEGAEDIPGAGCRAARPVPPDLATSLSRLAMSCRLWAGQRTRKQPGTRQRNSPRRCPNEQSERSQNKKSTESIAIHIRRYVRLGGSVLGHCPQDRGLQAWRSSPSRTCGLAGACWR